MGRRRGQVEARRDSQRWSDDDARAALKEFARSGMSAEDFADGRGYSAQRLTYWKKRLSAANTVSFVPVELPVVSTPPLARAQIEISCGDVVIRVREELDAEHVARIAFALAAERARRC